jgi:hypothetical protein
MPGVDFPIPISQLNGVRIAVPETDRGLRESARRRLEHILKQTGDKPGNPSTINLHEIIHGSTVRTNI